MTQFFVMTGNTLKERVQNFNDYTTKLISCAAEVLDARKFLKRSKENNLYLCPPLPHSSFENILRNRN